MQVHARLKQCAYSHCQAVTDRPVEMSFVACACSFDVTTPGFGVGSDMENWALGTSVPDFRSIFWSARGAPIQFLAIF